jgi:hypothetical protein
MRHGWFGVAGEFSLKIRNESNAADRNLTFVRTFMTEARALCASVCFKPTDPHYAVPTQWQSLCGYPRLGS